VDRRGPFWRGPFGCEHPFDAGGDGVALLLPDGSLGGQLLDTFDAAVKALGRQHADLFSDRARSGQRPVNWSSRDPSRPVCNKGRGGDAPGSIVV
jgi:hypothetical protein